MWSRELIGIIIFNVFSNTCYTIVVPFLPLEFQKYDLGVEMYGYIFGMYAFAGMASSLIIGKLLVLLGRKAILVCK